MFGGQRCLMRPPRGVSCAASSFRSLPLWPPLGPKERFAPPPCLYPPLPPGEGGMTRLGRRWRWRTRPFGSGVLPLGQGEVVRWGTGETNRTGWPTVAHRMMRCLQSPHEPGGAARDGRFVCGDGLAGASGASSNEPPSLLRGPLGSPWGDRRQWRRGEAVGKVGIAQSRRAAANRLTRKPPITPRPSRAALPRSP